jgi:4'-phosphopantetheinyl transferase
LNDHESHNGEVHVIPIDLDQTILAVRNLETFLSHEERQRADRFYSELHRSRFIVGRGSLRAILGNYLAMEPGDLEFHRGEHGKPSLSHVEGSKDLQFNISHSHGLAILAVTLGRQIGIDLEQLRPMDNPGEIVARFFSTYERSIFLGLPEEQKHEAFFRCWTRKEAYLKATGDGLTFPLDRFDVSLAPGETPSLLRVEGRPGEESRWTLRDLTLGPNYVCSVAVEGSDWRVKYFHHSPANNLKIPVTGESINRSMT